MELQSVFSSEKLSNFFMPIGAAYLNSRQTGRHVPGEEIVSEVEQKR